MSKNANRFVDELFRLKRLLESFRIVPLDSNEMEYAQLSVEDHIYYIGAGICTDCDLEECPRILSEDGEEQIPDLNCDRIDVLLAERRKQLWHKYSKRAVNCRYIMREKKRLTNDELLKYLGKNNDDTVDSIIRDL